MGLLDEFITDISKGNEEKETEVKEKEERKGCFDGQYDRSFLDYCEKGGR